MRAFLLLLLGLAMAGCGTHGAQEATTVPAASESVQSRVAWQPPSDVRQVDVPSSGIPVSNYAERASLSRDGSVIFFSSTASGLQVGSGPVLQVFRRDLATGNTTLISQRAGVAGDLDSNLPSASASGHKVAFESRATNLGLTGGGTPRILVGDSAGNLTMASTDAYGYPGNSGSNFPRFGGDDFLTFHSLSTNLLTDSNNQSDVFVKQLSNGALSMASLNTYGNQPNGPSTVSDISNDGRFIVFRSNASNIGGYTTPGWRVYLRDTFYNNLQSCSWLLTSSDSPSIAGDGSRLCFLTNTSEIWVYDRGAITNVPAKQFDRAGDHPQLSDDGRFLVAIRTDDPAFPADTDSKYDVYVKDLTTGNVSLVSTNFNNYACSHPQISGDGKMIAFTASNNHIYAVANPLAPPAVYEPPTTAEVVSTSATGAQANGGWQGVRNPRLSQDGRYLAFESNATNLHPDATTTLTRVYRKDLLNGAIEIASRQNGTNAAAEGYSYLAISADGSKVAFGSRRPDLTSIISPGTSYFTGYVRDLSVPATRLLGYKVNPSGFGGNEHVAVWTSERLAGDDEAYYNDVFLYRMSTGLFSWVSQPPQFTATNNTGPHQVSHDGRYSAFSNPSNGSSGGPLWVRDNQTGNVTNVTNNLYYAEFDLSGDGRTIAYRTGTRQLYIDRLDDGAPARLVVTTQAGNGKLSDDGRYAVYQWTSWPVGTTSGPSGVMKVYDWNTGNSANLDPKATFPQGVEISGDGRTIAFEGTVGSSNSQLFLKVNPLFTNSTVPAAPTLMSRTAGNVTANSACTRPSLTDDGRILVFSSQATNLGGFGGWNVYRKNVVTGELQVVNLAPTGESLTAQEGGVVSGSGNRVVFGGVGKITPINAYYDALWLYDFGLNTLEHIWYHPSTAVVPRPVAFAGEDKLVYQYQLSTMGYLFYRNLTSGALSQVSSDPYGFDRVSVSTNGKVCYQDMNSQQYLWNSVDGSRVNLGLLAPGASWFSSHVSPDGSRVGLAGGVYGQRPVIVMDTNGGNRSTLDSYGDYDAPRFSADNRYRVFLKGGRVMVQDSVTEPTIQVRDASLTAGCSAPCISGDGRSVAYQYNGQVYVAPNPFP